MQLAAIVPAIEPLSHEVTTSVLFKELALGHGDTGSLSHERVRVLDGAVPLRIFQFLIFVAGHAIELQQPIGEAGASRKLSRPHFLGPPIPRNHGLRSRTARRGSYFQNVRQGLAAGLSGEVPGEILVMCEHLGSESDERIDVDLRRVPWLGSENGRVLQRSHASGSGVTESFDGAKAPGAASLCGEPCVDERVAETIGQRVSQQPWKTVERSARQLRELIVLSGERHRDWRDLNAAVDELRGELEGRVVPSVLHRDRSNGSPPQADLRDHDSSPHFHLRFVDVSDRRRPDARFRRWPANFNCSTGLTVGDGTSASKRSTMSKARQTRTRPDSRAATSPDSRRSTVRFDTPASSASDACVRFRASRAPARRLPTSRRMASSESCPMILIVRHLRRTIP